MMFHERRVSAGRRSARACIAALAVSVTACEADRAVTLSFPEPTPASQFAPLAFVADVNVRTGQVAITAPSAAAIGGPTLSLDGSGRPALSLLGGEVVRLIPTNYVALPVGTFAPGKIRVTFDVTIENKLPFVSLTTPTWPHPPTQGVIMFPLEYFAAPSPGDTTGGGDTTVVNAGAVVPSVDWNGTGAAGSGAPFSFFNDVGCAGVSTGECARWMAYDLRILPTSMSSTRTVGFDIDATVDRFTTRMIVAADLVSVPPLVPAKIFGFVISSAGGPLAGVRATVTTGQSATTSASGTYAITGLPAGPMSVTLANLPSGCTAVDPRAVVLVAGDSTIADFVVTCSVQTGLVTGTLTALEGGAPIGNATVVSSTGGSAVTDAAGVYTIPAANAGSGTLSVSGLLAGCSVTPVPFVLQPGGAVTMDLLATCPTVPATGTQ